MKNRVITIHKETAVFHAMAAFVGRRPQKPYGAYGKVLVYLVPFVPQTAMKNKKTTTPTQGGPLARPIGRLALKGTAKNWVAGKLRIVFLCQKVVTPMRLPRLSIWYNKLIEREEQHGELRDGL